MVPPFLFRDSDDKRPWDAPESRLLFTIMMVLVGLGFLVIGGSLLFLMLLCRLH